MNRTETLRLGWEAKVGIWKERLGGGIGVPVFFAVLSCGIVVFLLGIILWMTFKPGLPIDPGYSLINYQQVLADRFWQLIWNTSLIGVGTTLLALFWAVPMAWFIHRTDIPWKAFFLAAIAVSVLIPGFMKAMGWILLLSPKIGLINAGLMQLFGLEEAPFSIYNRLGVIFVMSLMLTPTLFFLISGSFRSMDPALEESGEVLGVNKWKTLLYVTVPLMLPGIFAGAIYTFMTAVSIYEVPGLLVGFGKYPLLSTALFLNTAGTEQATRMPQYGMAGVYGLLITLPSLVAMYFYLRLIKQGHRYTVVTGKGYRPKLFPLAQFRYVGIIFILLYVSLAVILPLLVLIWTSLLPSLRFPSFEALSFLTFDYYSRIHRIMGLEVIWNTLTLMVTAPIMVLLLAVMISWVVIRSRIRGRELIDVIALMPHTIPGIGFAFALIMVAMVAAVHVPWLPLYGTIWIIIAANVVNRIAYATRITNSALLQISQELEDAAAVCGAGRLKTIFQVLVPLIVPSLVFGGVWTALLVFREVSMALILTNPGNVVMAVRVWTTWQGGQMAEASAMGVTMVGVLAVLFIIGQKLLKERIYGVQGL